METKELLENIQKIASDIKALEPVVIDLEGKSSIAEFLFICHGTSTAHIQGIAENIELGLKKDDLYPLGVEGRSEATWILMDYNSVLVHIFLEETRSDYSLEDLYKDSPKHRLEES